jgi:hypothetical protein
LTRPFADWSDQIHNPHAFLAARAQIESLVRIDGDKIGKVLALSENLRARPSDGINGDQPLLAFFLLDLACDGGPFSQSIPVRQVRMDRYFALNRPIRPLGRSDGKLRFADAFQYSSNCLGHRTIPWESVKRLMVFRKTVVLYHTVP